MNEASYIILRPEGEWLDFVDCTPTISRTFEEAQGQLASWYRDVPGAKIYRLVEARPAKPVGTKHWDDWLDERPDI